MGKITMITPYFFSGGDHIAKTQLIRLKCTFSMKNGVNDQ